MDEVYLSILNQNKKANNRVNTRRRKSCRIKASKSDTRDPHRGTSEPGKI